jgi:hypothetical protein
MLRGDTMGEVPAMPPDDSPTLRGAWSRLRARTFSKAFPQFLIALYYGGPRLGKLLTWPCGGRNRTLPGCYRRGVLVLRNRPCAIGRCGSPGPFVLGDHRQLVATLHWLQHLARPLSTNREQVRRRMGGLGARDRWLSGRHHLLALVVSDCALANKSTRPGAGSPRRIGRIPRIDIFSR